MHSFATMTDATRIAYRWDGPRGAPVLLLSNSLGTTMEMWAPQIAALSYHFRVLRYDARGQGLSDAPEGAYSIDRMGRDVIDLLDGFGIEQAHFCGLSMGGMIGQWLAVRAPDRINRLVLANTAAYMGPATGWQARIDSVLTHGMAAMTKAALIRWFTPDFIENAPEAVAQIHTMLLQARPSGYAGGCAAIRDMDQRPTAHLNHLPTLVIAGEFDPATPVADAAFLAQSASDARMVLLSGAHLSNVECADAFSAAVIQHMTARSWRAG